MNVATAESATGLIAVGHTQAECVAPARFAIVGNLQDKREVGHTIHLGGALDAAAVGRGSLLIAVMRVAFKFMPLL